MILNKDLINGDTYMVELEFPNHNWIAGFWPGAYCILSTENNKGEWLSG